MSMWWRVLHRHRPLLLRGADEASDRRVLQSGPLQVRLESLEVLVGRIRDGVEIFCEAATVFLKEGLRALEHRELAHNVGKERCIQGCVPPAVGLRLVSRGIGCKVIFEFFAVHEVVEQSPP